MSFLHCHTKNCKWSQDDFWEFKIKWKFWTTQRPFGYNPLSLVIEDFLEYKKPRIINMDRSWANSAGFKSNNILSWRIMIWSMKRHIKRLFTQKWWTWKSWKKASENAVCPKCGQKNFDID